MVFKKFFSAIQASVWSKNKGGEPGSPGISPRSATAIEGGVLNFAIAMIYHMGNYSAKNFRSDLTDLCGCLLPRKDSLLTIVWINADF